MSTWSCVHEILIASRELPITVLAKTREERNNLMSRLMNGAKHRQHDGYGYQFKSTLTIVDDSKVYPGVTVVGREKSPAESG